VGRRWRESSAARLLDFKERRDQLIALRQQRLGRVAVGRVRRVQRRRRHDHRVVAVCTARENLLASRENHLEVFGAQPDERWHLRRVAGLERHGRRLELGEVVGQQSDRQLGGGGAGCSGVRGWETSA